MEAKTKFMYSVESKEVGTALNASATKLTVEQFVSATNFEIDKLMFNEFWQIVVNRRRVYMHTPLLAWMGYEGETRYTKQILLLFKHNISSKFGNN